MKRTAICTALLAAALAGPALAADARLAHIFQDNMVLQRQKPVPVWGWAPPGTAVEVSFAGQTKSTKAGENGRWQVDLDPMEASAEGRPLTVKIGETTITRKNVLVGEVWLAAGQSNMNHAGPDRDTGVYPHYVSPAGEGKPPIRLMQFGWGASLTPLDDVDPSRPRDEPWQTVPENPTPTSMNLSRYFARVVRDGLNVPVGIVHVAVSGTNQAAWMSKETLEQFPAKGKANFYEAFLADAEAGLAKDKGPVKSWADFAKADAEWRKTGKGRWPGSSSIVNFPTALYNTRIHPAAPFAIRGAIWHQGEGGPGGPYGDRLVAMARQWRKLFGQDFVFLFGTLTRNTAASPPIKPELSWFYRSSTNVGIRRAADLFADDKNAGMVEFFDIGDPETHFHNKAEAGRRMGLAALTVAYGQEHLYNGPRVEKVEIDGPKATLTFANAGKGLVYEPSLDGISGFIVQGKKGQLRWADVKLTGPMTIEVTDPTGEAIETIAYGVAQNPHETVFNSENLPASPFRHNVGRMPWAGHLKGGMVTCGKGAVMDLAHVRRDGYMLQLHKGRNGKAASVSVEAYVPAEWDGCTVEIAGKPVDVTPTEKDGRRVVTFEAPTDGSWIIVARPGKAEAFRKIDRY